MSFIKKKLKLKELDLLYEHFSKASPEVAGYPANQFFDYSKLFRFLNFSINNVGDPFENSSYYRINTHALERELIEEMARLYHAPEDDFWGYVTNGGSEGNTYGLFLARELYPDGIVFYSEDAHYSVPKINRLLRMKGVKVKSLPTGEMDCNALQEALLEHPGIPIICATIGTTMKGAVDDVERIKEVLSDLEIKKYYIHCDAAFFGMLLPFLPEPQSFDFRAGIDSMAISGHKMVGTPMPCGVVLVKKKNVNRITQNIEITGSRDNTITGSRNGITPLFLWYELKNEQRKTFQNIAQKCIQTAGYSVKKFNEVGIKAWRNKNSIIVVFPRPSVNVVRKWQLAVEDDIAHLITLPQVTNKVIDKIVRDVSRDLRGKVSKKKAA